MPTNSSGVISILIFLVVFALWVVVIIRLAVRVIRNRCASVKTVKAVVIDKNKIEVFSQYAGNGKREKYVVVFLAGEEKLSFYVSEFSYDGYRLNESGTLKYQGDRLIDFN